MSGDYGGAGVYRVSSYNGGRVGDCGGEDVCSCGGEGVCSCDDGVVERMCAAAVKVWQRGCVQLW